MSYHSKAKIGCASFSSLYDYKFSNLSTYPFSIFMAFLRVTLGFSVSGQKSLATARDAGADMTEAVSKCVEDTWGKEEARSIRAREQGLRGGLVYQALSVPSPAASGVRGLDRNYVN